MAEYTTKDLLLTTKDKLKEIEIKLRRLAELTYIDCDKNIERVRYVIQPDTYGGKPELDCVVDWNSKTLKGRLTDLAVRLNLYAWGRESGLVLRNNNGKNYININEYSLGIPDEHQDEFRAVADEILAEEYIKEFLRADNYFGTGDDGRVRAYLSPSNISIAGEIGNCGARSVFTYSPADDTAKYYGQKVEIKDKKDTILDSDILLELLNTPLNQQYLTEYQMQAMDSSLARRKEIIVPEFTNTNGRVDFQVTEDEKRLYLGR